MLGSKKPKAKTGWAGPGLLKKFGAWPGGPNFLNRSKVTKVPPFPIVVWACGLVCWPAWQAGPGKRTCRPGFFF